MPRNKSEVPRDTLGMIMIKQVCSLYFQAGPPFLLTYKFGREKIRELRVCMYRTVGRREEKLAIWGGASA